MGHFNDFGLFWINTAETLGISSRWVWEGMGAASTHQSSPAWSRKWDLGQSCSLQLRAGGGCPGWQCQAAPGRGTGRSWAQQLQPGTPCAPPGLGILWAQLSLPWAG